MASFVAGGGIQSESISEFDPRTLGGCALWLDAADSNTLFTDTAGTTLAGNGANVLSWRDKSTNSHLATTSTAPSNVGITGAVVVRDAVSNRSQLQFGVQFGTLTATTNGSASFTGTTTTGLNTISGITGITGAISVGMLISGGANIPSGTFIVTYDGGANATLSNIVPTGATATITGTLNTLTITLPSQPVVGNSLVLNNSAGGLTGSSVLYFIRFVSYTGTTAIVALATTNALTTAQTVATSGPHTIFCDIGHTSYRIPDAAIPQGASNSTHFVVFKPSLTYRNQYPVSIGTYTNGGMREMNVSGGTNEITITNNSTIKASTTTVSPAASTLVTGMFSNYIVSGWNNGTPMTQTTTTDLQLATIPFNTGTGSGLIGSRANTLPAYGLMSEYIQFNRALQNDERQQVEGYLAWKWGLVQNLPVTHPYYYAKAPQTAFRPTNFPLCALWLDAADRNTVSGPVTQWNDKSGNGRHFVAAGSSPTPTFSNSAFLGRPGMQFTRTSNTSRSILQWTNDAAPLVTSDITVMMLVRRTASNTIEDRLLSATSIINSPDSDKANSFGFMNGYGGSKLVFRNNNATLTTPAIEFISTGASEIVTMTINKSTLTSTIRKTISTGTTTGTRTDETDSNLSLKQLRLGTYTEVQHLSSDTGQGTFQGVISEVLIYNSVLSSTQLINLEGYLAWKYQLATTLLPTTHLYYYSSPVGIVPTNITGCQLWLDSADVTSISFNVSGWNDKSGNGFNAAQSTIANQPTFSSSAVNFGDVNRFMSFSNLSMLRVIPCAGLFSVLNVKSGQTADNRASIFSGLTPGGTARFNATVAQNSGTDPTPPRPGVGGRRLDAESFSSLDASTDAYTVNTPFSLFQEANYTARTLNVFKDGTNIASGTAANFTAGGAGTTSDTNSSGISISSPSTAAAMNNVDVRELILFTGSPLTTAQRQQVEGYLAWKWNLQGNLPSSHPFTQANYFFNNTRPMTRYFVPPDIEGCQLWIDAADSGVVTLNGSDKVTAILDKSGLENNVTPNATSTITYASTLNSLPVLTFPSDGTLDGNILSTASLTRDPVNYSAFYVCRYPSSGANPVQAVNFDLSTATSTNISAASNATSTVLTVGSSVGFAVGRYVLISGVTSATAGAYNQTGLITAISSSTSITVELSLNTSPGAYTSGGTLTQLTASQMFGHNGRATNYNIQNVNYEAGALTGSRATSLFNYTTPTLTSNTFILGCVRQNGVFTLSTNGIAHTTVSFGFTGIGNKTTGAYSIFGGLQGLSIGEVIVYNSALTDAERRTIEGYLAWKWGIQRATNLTNPSVSTSGTSLVYPTAHPYYNFPPVDVTPMTPAIRLYKKPFDPSDLSPDLWLDSQDLSTIGVDANNRLVRWNSKGTATSPEFSIPSYLGSNAGFDGPLLSTSKLGAGSNMKFLDFSPGGVFPIAQANITSANEMVLTLGSPTTSYNTSSGSIEAYSISITGGTTTTTTATINFTGNTTNVPPFPVGSFVTFTGTSNTGTPDLNGNVYTVLTATPTQVTFSVTGTTGTVSGGTISPSSTSGTVTAQNLAIVNYTNNDVQPFVAGQLVNLSGGTFDSLTNIRLIRATSRSIQFLTTISVSPSITNGTVALVNPPHNIPANRQITLAFSSAQFNNGVDAAFIGRTFDGNSSITSSFTGSISSTTLTVGTVTSGFISAGMTLTGTGITGSVVTSVQTGTNTWTVTNPDSISVSSITITGASTIFPVVGSGTPYIVTSVATNTITLTLPHSIPSIQRGIMHFVNGHVSYGTIAPRSIQIPASAGVSTITTLTAHGLVNGDNINLNFINFTAGVALSGLTAPTNPINLNGYYSVSGSAFNTFQITLIQQNRSGGAAPTYNGTGGTTVMSPPTGQNTVSTIYFPVKAYCLERRDGTGISSNNVSVVVVSHNVTPPTRSGVFSSIQPVVFGTAVAADALAGDDVNSGASAFSGIGRDFAIRLGSFAGTAQRFSVKKNASNAIALFPANAGRAMTDDNSGFRIITTSINAGDTTIEDVPGVTTALAINGGRNELTVNNLNSQNQVTTAFRIIGIQTNGSNSMTIAYTGLLIAGQNPFVANGNFTISGFSTSGFNSAYTSVTSTVTQIPISAPFYGFITVTACTPAISSRPASGTYMPTNDTGVIFPTTRTTTLSTAHVRIGADTRANTGSGTGGITGTDAGLSNYCYDGGISEILVFNSLLSLERRQLLEGYLAQKYRSVTNIGASYNYLGSTALNLYNTTSVAIGIGGATCSASATTIGGLSLFLVTLTYSSASIQYQQGLSITVTGISPSGYNGTWTLVHSTTTTVQYYVSATLAASTVAGTITGTAQTNTFIHPYRLNPTTITGQHSLSLTSTTLPYAQDLVAWFDAANPNLMNNATLPANGTPPTDGIAVTRWAPTSGWWANTPLQLENSGTVTYYSTTSGKTQNGLPGIYIGGSTNRLSLATGAFSQYTTISNNNNFTWMIVFRPDSDASAETPVISVTSGTSNRLMLCSNGTFIYSNGTTSQTLTPTTALSNTKTHMITIYRDGTTLGYRIVSEDTTIGSEGFLAGTSTNTNFVIPTFTSGTPIGSPSPSLTFGAIGVSGFTASFTGSIFEAALFRSAMTLQSMQQVGGYLAHKWGLQRSLPPRHGYKRISA